MPETRISAEPVHPAGLRRGLSLISTASIIVTTVIGTGIFLKARVMTCNVGSPGLVLLAYAVAGIFSLAGAVTYAELSTLMPRAGGDYNFLGAAYGRLWAFLYGWYTVLFAGGAAQGAKTVVFVIFFNDLLGGTLSPGVAQVLAIATLAGVVALSLASIHDNGIVASVVTSLKVLLVAGIGFAAFIFGDGSWTNFAASGAAGACDGVPATARLGIAGFGAAVVGALWSYNGWDIVARVAEEVRRPEWTLPRALVWATTLLIALYLLINAGFFYVLEPTAVASVPETSSVAAAAMVRLVGAGAVAMIAAGLMISTFGSLHAAVLAAARVPFAMARDSLLPRILAAVSSRTHIPTWSTILIGVLAAGFTLSGTFDILTDLVIFAALFFNGMSVLAVFVLRRKLPDAERPYRVWGYPVVPAIFLISTAYLMINTLLATPGRALAGIGLILVGVPVYAYYARNLPPTRPEDWIGERQD